MQWPVIARPTSRRDALRIEAISCKHLVAIALVIATASASLACRDRGQPLSHDREGPYLVPGRDLPPSAAAICPGCNVIAIVIPGLRADADLAAHMPHLFHFTKGSQHFTNALAQAPVSAESFASVMSGRYPSLVDDASPWLPELLAVKHALIATGAPEPLRLHTRANATQTYTLFPSPHAPPSHRAPSGLDDLLPRIVEWLGRAPVGPFFVGVVTFDAHCPFAPPADFIRPSASTPRDHFAGRCGIMAPPGAYGTATPLVAKDLSAGQRNTWRDLYLASLSHLDVGLGQLFRVLEQRGILKNTLVVITSTGGQELGDNERLGSDFLSEAVLRVPLILYIPGVAPQVLDAPVQLIDLAPTILASVGRPLRADLDGINLIPVVRGQPRFGPERVRLSQRFNSNGQPAAVRIRRSARLALDIDPAGELRQLVDLQHAERALDPADHVREVDELRAAWHSASIHPARSGTARPTPTGTPNPALHRRLHTLKQEVEDP